MKRAAMLVLAAALVAIAALRRRTPTYATWREYVESDQEGDALPPGAGLDPDIYLIALLAAGQGRD